MNPLLRDGLWITIQGLGIVFAALALLWGMMAILTRAFSAHGAPEPADRDLEDHEAAQLIAEAEAAAAAELTAERARIAALVAAALMANAIPILLDVPTGPAFEHGRTAPSWVSANRSRTLRSWQPPRRSEP